MKKILLAGFGLVRVLALSAQTFENDDHNVVISLEKREFRFVKGDDSHPVQIKEETSRTYFCNNYRAQIGVGEFYSDMELIDDVDIRVDGSKKHGITPLYELYHSADIFYSDARLCSFALPLVKKGATSTVTFKKTTLDPHYFTSVHFMESEPILEQEIRIVVPSWMNVEFKEFNFTKYLVKKSVDKQAEETVYVYSMKNIPAMVREESAPGLSYYSPHLLVMCKSAELKNSKLTYFNTVKDQYNWYHQLVMQIGNDEKTVKEKTLDIIKNETTDTEKARAVLQWVQDNIRYIAFEDGIAGFKPEKAQEVLRKKYGDCKGMANLVTEMLRSIGLDARRCWIGTRHLVYDYSTPCLAVDNHMIAAWMDHGKPVFLDGTEKYLGMGEIAERIQGREVLIEDGAAGLVLIDQD